MDTTDQHINPSPLRNAGPISKLFFWWLNPIFTIGYKKSLEEDDMYNLVHADTTKHISDRLHKEWLKELKKEKEGGKPSLGNAIIRTYRLRFCLLGIVVFIEETFKVIQPILLGWLLRYFAPGSEVTKQEAYLYAGGVALSAFVLAISHHPYFFGVQRIGMWMRVSACALIYNKSLKLSNSALGQTTTGHVVNLISNDVVRFDYAPMFLHYLWVGPLQAIFVLVYLWYMIGIASLASFIILISLIPVQGTMGRLFTKLRRKVAVQTDERVRLMNEILTGMRVIKMYCWEKMFAELVKKVRRTEARDVSMAMDVRAVSATVAQFGGRMICFCVVIAICLFNPIGLRPWKLFPALAVLQALRSNVLGKMNYVAQFLGETSASVDRVQVVSA